MISKKHFLVLLDTDLATDYLFDYSQRFFDIRVSIYSTLKGFEAPLFITPFTYFELFKGRIRDRNETLKCLWMLNKKKVGILHYVGLLNDLTEKFLPSYWIDGDFKFDEFVSFFDSVTCEIVSYIQDSLKSYFVLTSFITLFVNTTECLLPDARTLYAFTKLINEPCFQEFVLSIIQSLITKDFFVNRQSTEINLDIFWKVNNLIIRILRAIVGIDVNCEINIESFEKKIRDNKDKIRKIVRDAGISRDLLPSSKSNNEFIVSLINNLYRDVDKTFFHELIKYLVVHSPLNKGSFSINDFVDILNLNCSNDKLMKSDYLVIYSTKEKKWRDFINENVKCYPFLNYCTIIGDEGEFESYNKNKEI